MNSSMADFISESSPQLFKFPLETESNHHDRQLIRTNCGQPFRSGNQHHREAVSGGICGDDAESRSHPQCRPNSEKTSEGQRQ